MPDFHALIKDHDLKIGTYLGEFATSGIGKILKEAGCEFVFVDMEHSGFSFETAKQILGNLHAERIATFLRPPSKATHHLQRAADIGAQAIIAPMLGTARQAADCIAAIKYNPQGQRGVALGIAHDNYQKNTVRDALGAANAKTGLVALIETAQGVENCDEIAATEGVDCLWIGHLDLSASLDIPGEFDNPLFLDAVTAIMSAAEKNRKPVGQLVASPEQAAQIHRQGCNLICYLGDIWLLQKAMADGISQIRKLTR